MKRLLPLLLLCFSYTANTQLQTPEQFLGYKTGTHFTPHHQLAAYVKAVAAASPATIKLQQYGTTNEGRPLLAAFISSAQNIAALESIRQNNIELTNGKGNSNVAIVWLSYNVHGNEPSSSEAAMLTLHALANPANVRTKAWLQNTLVILDPCLNPDGRDRYVNWYNSVAGKTFDAAQEAREHFEPWPRGRSNHYNFDLNRDWAWQTQVESQARLALYQQWLPQVHVDFHEQGYNEPYYFAPAAEPFHEVITKWQRDFQTTIGRAHATYFDEKGWLYFTKERFDLLYPSYGDTYPIYNGSIGMTYEQGGIGAGLAVVMDNGDTLTLADRAEHHYTTSLSTVETASKNARHLLEEFSNYYKAANKGIGEYAAYIIKGGGEAKNVPALLNLLRKNGITYAMAKAGNTRGFSYRSGKQEAINLTETSVVIPAAQPKSNLLKVLFEPSSKLTDSATYDITAWSLPYVYGVEAYAVTTPVLYGANVPEQSKGMRNAEAPAALYAYVIQWQDMNAARLTAQLLHKGVRLRVATTPFESGGQKFDRGAIIILKAGNAAQPNLWQLVREEANNAGVNLSIVKSGFVDKGLDFGSSSVLPLKPRKVALLTGDGVGSTSAGEVWHFFEQTLNYPLTLINAADAGRVNWSDYDVIIMPDGAYRFLSDKAAADALKSWISGGGHIVALEGAVAAFSRLDWGLKLKKTDDSGSKNTYDAVRSYEDRERLAVSANTPGSIFKVALDNSHPLAFGYPNYYYTLKQDATIYEFLKEDGWNVGVIKKDKQVAGFVGSRLSQRLQDGLLFGVQEMGRGTLTYFADDVLFRSFWENGKLLFFNSVFFVGQ